MVMIFGLALIGLLLIYFEFFVPGGILAVLGTLLLIGSIVTFVWTQDFLGWLVVYIAALLGLLALTIRLALWRIKKSKGKNTLYAGQDQEGFVASSYNEALIGKSGVAATDLRPSGHVVIEGERVQVVSQSAYVKKGEAIEVIGGKGSRLIVRKEEK